MQCQSAIMAAAEAEQELVSKLKKDVNLINAKESSSKLEKYLCKTVNDGIKGHNHEVGLQAGGFDGFHMGEHFAVWMGYELGGQRSDQLASAAYILTTIVILETAQHVLNIGSGFHKMDMSALTIHQIKETVKRIEEKVDKLLAEPLNTAIRYFNDVLLELSSKSYKKAYENLSNVIANARKGLDFASGNKRTNSIQSYEEFVKAIRLIVFSTVLLHSYDEREVCFKPIFLLTSDEENLIASKLEELIRECSEQRLTIDTYSLRTLKTKEDKDRVAQVQNIYDSILKITYQYISQARKWSDFTKKYAENDSLQFSVLPAKLPMGCDHKAEMIVGVQTHENGEDSVVKIHVRRAENAVFYEHDSKVFVKQFKSDSDMLDMGDAVQFSSCSGALRIVSTATFGAKFWMPELLREYRGIARVHNSAAVYGNTRGYFLYTDTEGIWRISKVIGGYPGYVRSVDTAASPTEVTDWEYDYHGHDGHGSWRPAGIAVSHEED